MNGRPSKRPRGASSQPTVANARARAESTQVAATVAPVSLLEEDPAHDEAARRANESLQRRVQAAHLPDLYAAVESFDNAWGRGLTCGQLQSYARCTWMPTGMGFVFTGPPQSGKSFVLSALARAALDQGHTVRCWSIRNVLAGFHGTPEEQAELLDALRRPELLVLDDWGKPALAVKEAAFLVNLLAARTSMRKPLLILVS